MVIHTVKASLSLCLSSSTPPHPLSSSFFPPSQLDLKGSIISGANFGRASYFFPPFFSPHFPPSSWTVHAGYFVVAGMHPSIMTGCLRVRAMECTCTETTPPFVLLSEKVVGCEVRTSFNMGKIPSVGRLRGEGVEGEGGGGGGGHEPAMLHRAGERA